MSTLRRALALLPVVAGATLPVAPARAASSYEVVSYAPPPEVKLEVSGVTPLPDGRVAVAVRKGEVWVLERPDADPADPRAVGYKRVAAGLHEPHGLLWHEGALLVVQRSELTRLRDLDGDDVIDEYATLAKGWGVSGAYHEYAYGPVMDGGGHLWITLNSRMGRAPQIAGHRTTENPWRGWALRVTPAGVLEPMCAGFRTPSGFGANAAGEIFGTDQQGNWWGTSPILHLRKGVFFGHQDALLDANRPESPVRHPGVLPGDLTVAEAIQRVPGYAPPAVWLPYAKMGQSPTAIAFDLTGGKFGPFAGQMFVGEFVLSGVNRVFLEKVGGEYQGAAFRFVGGLDCGAVSMTFLRDGSLLVGETNRGWNSRGTRSFGLERVRWTGRVPFEVRALRARPDGFELEFTGPVDRASAETASSYAMKSYTYRYHEKYGSPEIDSRPVVIEAATMAADATTVRLRCTGLRAGYVHELTATGVRSLEGSALVHDAAYYTLNRRPE